MGNSISRVNLGQLTSTTTYTLVPLSPPQPQVLPNSPVITQLPIAVAPSRPRRTTASYTAAASPLRKRPHPVVASPAKKRATFPAENYGLPEELGECVRRDVELLRRVGWQGFVKARRNGGDLSDLSNIENHPARRLLNHYKHRGVPVKFTSPKWSRTELKAALTRGAHKSCNEHIDFLNEEFVDMIKKGQWVILPATMAMELEGLRLSPPGVVPQRDRRPRWVCDYTWSGVNRETLPLAAMEAMQFGHALERILREILLANPAHGPVHLNKTDLSDGFYRMDLNSGDAPRLGVVFPTKAGTEPMVAVPLVLPMGWKNSPPAFSTATETIADLANQRLRRPDYHPSNHPLDQMAADVPLPVRTAQSLTPASEVAVEITTSRDPSLPTTGKPLEYVDIFVDDFVSLGQSPKTRRVRKTLLHSIDHVFRPVTDDDSPFRREPVSLKKLRKGECSWDTIKLVLGWLVDTVSMTIHLPPHRIDRLWEILDSIPKSQKRTSMKKWHKVLGELRSMAIALPGARNMFGRLQNAIQPKSHTRVDLGKGVHQALDDFRWIAKDLTSRPTRLAELIPLAPSAEGHHDASGNGAGGAWFPGEHLRPREGWQADIPVLWRLEWPEYITRRLVTAENPTGTITNSDLELAGGLIHLEAIAQTFDTRERTVVSKGDNLNTTFWERKGSTTTNSPPAYLLRLFGIHQRYHRYVPRFDYIAGLSNHVADALSRDFHLSMPQVFSQLAPFLSQQRGYQVWTPPSDFVSAIISALLRKQSPRESLLVEPPPPSVSGTSGSPSALSWASTPFSKPSRTKYQSYKSSSTEFVAANLQPREIKSSLDRLRITYGQLPRRSSQWGPTIPA